MAYWLMKSEPAVFSIDQLAREKIAGWDGVRNYQARNFLRAMQPGDHAFFYHSSVVPSAIVGEMEIVRAAYPDPTQFEARHPHFDAASKPEAPRWDQVDVQFVRKFDRPLALETIRAIPALQGMMLLHRRRLSVQPVAAREWMTIQHLLTR